MVTTTDSGGNRQGWRITDELLGLRCWGSDRFYGLPRQATVDCTIGSEPTSTIQVNNPHGFISRIHVRLSRTSGKWQLFNESKNGTRVDGTPVDPTMGAVLLPGSVVVMGRTTLVAESERLVRLRRVLFRLLGWTAYEAVDQALCSLRDAAVGRIPLVLKGKGARLELVARRLHLETLGTEPPFVVCDKEVRASIAEATGGTLCIAKHARKKITQIIPVVRTPGSRMRATIISPSKAEVDWISDQAGRIASIVLPTPQQRRAELPRILTECIEDVIAETPGLPEVRLHEEDIGCLCAHGFLDLGDIEEQALRLVVYRSYGPTQGDAVLGLSHGTLFHWARTRGLK